MTCYSGNSRMGRGRYDIAEGDSCVGAWLRGVAALKVSGVDWSCHDCCAVRSILSPTKGKQGDEKYKDCIVLEYMWSDEARSYTGGCVERGGR